MAPTPRRSIRQTSRFKKDLRLAKKRGKDIAKLANIVNLLLRQANLPIDYRPHQLKGSWGNVWECHIEPDWLLVYDVTSSSVTLIRTGSHADLFE